MKMLQRLALLVAVGLGSGGLAPALEPAKLDPETARTANALRDRIVAGSKASDWVREIIDQAGPRLAGSPGDRAAVAASLALLQAQGFANVHAEKVMVPVWKRVAESGEVVGPVPHRLALTALGGSVATPEGGLEGEIVRAGSIEELDAKGEACRGRIVFIDIPMARMGPATATRSGLAPRVPGTPPDWARSA